MRLGRKARKNPNWIVACTALWKCFCRALRRNRCRRSCQVLWISPKSSIPRVWVNSCQTCLRGMKHWLVSWLATVNCYLSNIYFQIASTISLEEERWRTSLWERLINLLFAISRCVTLLWKERNWPGMNPSVVHCCIRSVLQSLSIMKRSKVADVIEHSKRWVTARFQGGELCLY